jgi:hypothetical protein
MNNTPKFNGQMKMNIADTFTELWRQRFFLLNELIINIICNYGNLSYIKQHTIENSRDFANVLQKYYGYYNAKNFELLFIEHTDITADLLRDIKSGNKNSAGIHRMELKDKVDEISKFFSSVNPYWNEDEWRNILYEHSKVIEEGAIKQLTTKCKTDIIYNEQTVRDIKKIADYAANGIIKQFTYY